jgi:hypothetical protein
VRALPYRGLAVAMPLAMAVTTLLVAATATPARPTLAPPAAVPSPARHGGPPAADSLRPDAYLPVPDALVDAGLDLRAGPVPVPLELRMPTVDSSAPVIGVGMTPTDVMDAPMGGDDDPVWRQAFWYRGSAVPGTASTAVIAGHVNDPLGRPGTFAHLEELEVGDEVVVHDVRNGLDIAFTVTSSHSYPLAETTDAAVLTRIYGAGPVAGTGPQPSADGLAHLTLITCTGTFRDGTHDHRLVVEATRSR